MMKKLLFFIFLLGFLGSCRSSSVEKEETDQSERIDTLNIEKFAYEFYQSHRNLANNSITRAEAAKEFQEKFKEAVNDRALLNGIPMNLRTLKAENNGKCTAHFWATHINRDLIVPFKGMNFDYAVTIPNDIAKNLVEHDNYLLDVTYIGHIDNIKAFQRIIGFSDWVQTESVGLKPNDNRYDETQNFDIELGLMLVDLNDIKPYNRY